MGVHLRLGPTDPHLLGGADVRRYCEGVSAFPGWPRLFACRWSEIGIHSLSFTSARPWITSLAVTSKWMFGSSREMTFFPQPQFSTPTGLTHLIP
jgi:hypothetical protein